MVERARWEDEAAPPAKTIKEAIKLHTQWMPRPSRVQFVELFEGLQSLAFEGLVADAVATICRCLGPEAERSLATGKGRPRLIPEEMVYPILEFVGSQRGAPRFQIGQETTDFRNGLDFATFRARTEDINRQIRLLSAEYLSGDE